ncbi:hypothetical protein C9Z24_20225 [Escherichia coli]|nr:hypothetical protein [Escherichia coli]EEV6085112.1 hypothetical protein [Escherichia coli]EEY7642974.1 hypothetical protein [Escherichia coli]EFN8016831.1 hypothetical protein [Escherichia coli]EFO1159795.1 hypothetical protein [Escherichia coli]
MHLSNQLKNKRYFFEPSLTPIRVQAAYSLACLVFSNSNTHGYPQEQWITVSSPYPPPPGQFPHSPHEAEVKFFS